MYISHETKKTYHTTRYGQRGSSDGQSEFDFESDLIFRDRIRCSVLCLYAQSHSRRRWRRTWPFHGHPNREDSRRYHHLPDESASRSLFVHLPESSLSRHAGASPLCCVDDQVTTRGRLSVLPSDNADPVDGDKKNETKEDSQSLGCKNYRSVDIFGTKHVNSGILTRRLSSYLYMTFNYQCY
jgi:hypothetical protein